MSARATARKARRDYLRKIAKVRLIRARIILARKNGKNLSRLHKLYAEAKKQRAKAKRVYYRWKRIAGQPLREKALDEARKCIGIMERGGNNRGPEVMRIIRENNGSGPEPWCGDFVAHCYRVAGSKSVTRPWASVRLLRGLAGIFVRKNPQPGDLVVFTFDHVGIFEKGINGSTIQTIEGNTGASGAVSDSSTGGDGVYRKLRSKSLVAYYLRVSR